MHESEVRTTRGTVAHFRFVRWLLVLACGWWGLALAADVPRPVVGVVTGSLAGFDYETWVEGAPSAAQDLPVIIGLHWIRSDPAEFRPYLTHIGAPVRVVLVRGRYAAASGYSFFPVAPHNYYKLPASEKRLALIAETDALARFIRAIADKYPARIKPMLVGASQGGDLTYAIALRHGDLVSLAAPLLGTLDASLITPQSRAALPPVSAFDGEDDPIVPAAAARSYQTSLRQAGYTASLRIYPGVAHDIPDVMREDMHRQFRCVAGSRPREIARCLTVRADP